MEAGGGAFLEAVARGFAEISAAEPWRVVRVDAARPPAAVATTIRALVAERLQVPA
jgi:thymidylate kinase